MQNKKLLGAGAVGLGALGLGGALYARHRHNQQAAAQKQAAYKQAEPVLADMMGGYDSAALHPEVQKSLAHRTALLSALGAGVPLAALGATMGGDIFGTNRAALIGGGLGALGGGAAGYALSSAADAAQLRHDADRQATKGMGVVAGKLDPRVHGPHTSLVNRIFSGKDNVATPEEVAAHVQSQG